MVPEHIVMYSSVFFCSVFGLALHELANKQRIESLFFFFFSDKVLQCSTRHEQFGGHWGHPLKTTFKNQANVVLNGTYSLLNACLVQQV